MSMNKLRSYDFDQVLVMVNGVSLNGWTEEGGVEFEIASEAISDMAGAGGEVVASKNNDQRVYADISVMQTSRAATYLGGLLQTQERLAAGPMPPVVFFMRNFITGEIVKSSSALFKTRPTPNQNAEASERVFRLLLPYAAGKIIYGTTAV